MASWRNHSPVRRITRVTGYGPELSGGFHSKDEGESDVRRTGEMKAKAQWIARGLPVKCVSLRFRDPNRPTSRGL